MTRLELPHLHLCHINNQHTLAYSIIKHVQSFLKKNMHIYIIVPSCVFPPQLEKLSNCHYQQTKLYQLVNLFQSCRMLVSGGMIYFLTIFKTTSNDTKLAVTQKLGKSCLGCGENIPLNYRQ